MEGFLVTMKIGKPFDSLDHKFLISVLGEFGLGQNFISWTGINLKNQVLLTVQQPQNILK